MASETVDGRCLSNTVPWSVVELSLPNAQLAGVLAGFMVIAITFLLGRQTNRDQEVIPITHTLALFGAGILVLGLDSYLFGSVYATKPFEGADADTARRVCEAAWLQVMPAAGMLGLGAILLVSGIGWMFAQHAGSSAKPNKQFTYLANTLVALTIFGVTALLIFTSLALIDAMYRVFGEDVPHYAKFIVASTGLLLFLTAAYFVFRRTRKFRDFGAIEWKQALAPTYKSIEVAAVAAAVFAVAGPIWAWILGHWQTFPFSDVRVLSHTLWHFTISGHRKLWESVALCLWLPGLISLLIAASVPGSWKKPSVSTAGDDAKRQGTEAAGTEAAGTEAEGAGAGGAGAEGSKAEEDQDRHDTASAE